MYMYIACTYCSRYVHRFINLYIHVCTMYRALCTDLHILVHMVRIPDGYIMSSTGTSYIFNSFFHTFGEVSDSDA